MVPDPGLEIVTGAAHKRPPFHLACAKRLYRAGTVAVYDAPSRFW